MSNKVTSLIFTANAITWISVGSLILSVAVVIGARVLAPASSDETLVQGQRSTAGSPIAPTIPTWLSDAIEETSGGNNAVFEYCRGTQRQQQQQQQQQQQPKQAPFDEFALDRYIIGQTLTCLPALTAALKRQEEWIKTAYLLLQTNVFNGEDANSVETLLELAQNLAADGQESSNRAADLINSKEVGRKSEPTEYIWPFVKLMHNTRKAHLRSKTTWGVTIYI